MKNSVILLPNFHVWCQEVVKFSLKLSLKLSPTVKVSMKVSMKISRLLDTRKFGKTIYQKVVVTAVYRKFRYFRGRYDTIRYIYGYRIDIISIYRSITTVQRHGAVWAVSVASNSSSQSHGAFDTGPLCAFCSYLLLPIYLPSPTATNFSFFVSSSEEISLHSCSVRSRPL